MAWGWAELGLVSWTLCDSILQMIVSIGEAASWLSGRWRMNRQETGSIAVGLQPAVMRKSYV